MTWLVACIGALVAAWAVRRIVAMGPLCCHRTRVGLVLLGAASLCATLSPIYGPPPAWLYAAGLFGVLLAVAWPPRMY